MAEAGKPAPPCAVSAASRNVSERLQQIRRVSEFCWRRINSKTVARRAAAMLGSAVTLTLEPRDHERRGPHKSAARLFAYALTFIALAAVAAPAAAPAALLNQTLIVGSEQDYPPFAIGMTDETADGFTVELWKEIAKSQGLAYEIRVRPFGDLLQGFKAGAIDVLLNLAQSDERRKFADFSITHVTVTGGIFVRNADSRIRSEADLTGKSIIVIKSDLAQDYAVGKGWERQLVLVDTAETGLRKLASGQYDAMLLSQLAGVQTIRNQQLSGVKALEVKVGFSQQFSFAVPKGNAALLARINEGLALAGANGVSSRLYEKWFGIYEPRPRTLRESWPELTAMGALVIAAWAVTYFRRRQRDRQAAAMLRDSEERWKFALDGAGDGVWDTDLVNGTTQYSTRWKEMLGYADNEISSDPNEWSGRVHPDDLASVLADKQLCIDGITNSIFSEFRMRTKTGQWIWILSRGKVIARDANGKVLRMIGTHTDISDRKARQTREAGYAAVMTMLATNASLSMILASIVQRVESAGDWRCGVIISNATCTYLLTGAKFPERAAYQLGSQGVSPGEDDGAGSTSTLGKVGQSDQIGRDFQADLGWDAYGSLVEQAILRECWPQPIVGTGGAILGRLVVCFLRPGEPTPAGMAFLAEAAQMASLAIERKCDEQELRDSEELLQRALEASHLALWDSNLTTGEIFLSEAWTEMLGAARQTTRTTFKELTNLVPEEDQSRVAGAMRDALRGRTPRYSVEHRIRRPDGKLIWILSQGRVVERASDGQVRRVVGTNRDISERVQAQATQRQLESRLREAQRLEAIGTLAGGIAHDFNNIMAAILGNVALARHDVEQGGDVRVYLQQIHKAGQRARSLVQKILAFSRHQPGEFFSLSLRPLVEETLLMLRSIVGPATLLRRRLPNRPLRVMGDATQLQQVILNLGTNAWQALPGGAGSIEFGLEDVTLGEPETPAPAGLSPGPYVHLWVRDDGCGMDEATRQRIFEPFFTTKPVDQGTGLGLAVVHGIVESHGGVIFVTTATGKGSTFDVYLPQVGDDSGLVPLEATSVEVLTGRGQHVLYVDDDEVMVLMVSSLLERLGYRASCTQDASEAIDWVKHDPERFDLVVTDFNMPHMNGLDVARRLRELRPGLPVVISSGYISEAMRADAAELGVRAVVHKEHTFEEIGAVIQSILNSVDRFDAVSDLRPVRRGQ